MYHGEVVPGFPQHPHRGFETVTIVRRGLIDHSDSLGATARFGAGDVQWLTAGEGIVHAEMFPLVEKGTPNPLELFQIWLNLPSADKLVRPHFAMLWNGNVPRRSFADERGRATEVTVIAGTLDGARPASPPPRSWASRPDTDVAIWCIRMQPGASWTLPLASDPRVLRSLYFFRGSSLAVDGEKSDGPRGAGDPGGCERAPRERRRGDRAAPPAGEADRRASRAARAVRDEHPGRDSACVRGLPADAIRGVALAGRRAGAPARGGAIREARRRSDGAGRRGRAFSLKRSPRRRAEAQREIAGGRRASRRPRA